MTGASSHLILTLIELAKNVRLGDDIMARTQFVRINRFISLLGMRVALIEKDSSDIQRGSRVCVCMCVCRRVIIITCPTVSHNNNRTKRMEITSFLLQNKTEVKVCA